MISSGMLTRSRTSAIALLVVTAMLVAMPSLLRAQSKAQRWQCSIEAGVALGNTYLDGNGAPSVEGKMGVAVGASLMRTVSTRWNIGASAHVISQSIDVTEAGDTWSGGKLIDGDVMASAELKKAFDSSFTGVIESGAGVALRSGADDILPFSTASAISPAASVGLRLERWNSMHTRAAAIVARARFVRMNVDAPDIDASGGTSRQFVIAARFTL
jgi:hypothetical protein